MRWLLLLMLASPAHAEAIDPDAWYPRLSGGVALGFRSGDIALATTQGASMSVQAEVKLRPALFVGATYDFASGSTWQGPKVYVAAHTAQLAVRNLLMSFGDKPNGLGGDMFVSAGLAREWNQWSAGELERNLLVLGAGATLLLPHDDTHRHLRFGLRLLFGRAPDPEKRAPSCDGPCDTATTTQPYDLSMIMEVSCHFGR